MNTWYAYTKTNPTLYQISCDREDIGMDDRLADLKLTAFDELTFE